MKIDSVIFGPLFIQFCDLPIAHFKSPRMTEGDVVSLIGSKGVFYCDFCHVTRTFVRDTGDRHEAKSPVVF
jgi:hypothetical protein